MAFSCGDGYAHRWAPDDDDDDDDDFLNTSKFSSEENQLRVTDEFKF